MRLAKGELQLSVLSMLGSYLNGDGAAGLLEACCGKSFEQVEELLAARFPRPDVRDSIRRLPETVRRGPDIGSAMVGGASESAASADVAHLDQTSSIEQTVGARAPVAPQVPPQTLPVTAPERVEPPSPGRFGVHFTADAEFRELLEEVRALASHRQPKGELLPLMKSALAAYRRELQRGSALRLASRCGARAIRRRRIA
jgi:hypothetical protein